MKIRPIRHLLFIEEALRDLLDAVPASVTLRAAERAAGLDLEPEDQSIPARVMRLLARTSDPAALHAGALAILGSAPTLQVDAAGHALPRHRWSGPAGASALVATCAGCGISGSAPGAKLACAKPDAAEAKQAQDAQDDAGAQMWALLIGALQAACADLAQGLCAAGEARVDVQHHEERWRAHARWTDAAGEEQTTWVFSFTRGGALEELARILLAFRRSKALLTVAATLQAQVWTAGDTYRAIKAAEEELYPYDESFGTAVLSLGEGLLIMPEEQALPRLIEALKPLGYEQAGCPTFPSALHAALDAQAACDEPHPTVWRLLNVPSSAARTVANYVASVWAIPTLPTPYSRKALDVLQAMVLYDSTVLQVGQVPSNEDELETLIRALRTCYQSSEDPGGASRWELRQAWEPGLTLLCVEQHLFIVEGVPQVSPHTLALWMAIRILPLGGPQAGQPEPKRFLLRPERLQAVEEANARIDAAEGQLEGLKRALAAARPDQKWEVAQGAEGMEIKNPVPMPLKPIEVPEQQGRVALAEPIGGVTARRADPLGLGDLPALDVQEIIDSIEQTLPPEASPIVESLRTQAHAQQRHVFETGNRPPSAETFSNRFAGVPLTAENLENAFKDIPTGAVQQGQLPPETQAQIEADLEAADIIEIEADPEKA